jgi:hypothetical protein
MDKSLLDGRGDVNCSLEWDGSLNTCTWGGAILGKVLDLRMGMGSLKDWESKREE